MRLSVRVVLIASLAATSSVFAGTFSDEFNSGASSFWGNQRGNWIGTGGVYDAQLPSNAPFTISLLPFEFTDCTVDVDINEVSDGGIWVRTDATFTNGVLLVTGGEGWGTASPTANAGKSIYWHVVTNGNVTGALQEAFNVFTPGQNAHLTVVVSGNTYQAYVDGVLKTTLVDNNFSSGRVGLYDFSPAQSTNQTINQTFDNFSVEGTTQCLTPPAGIHATEWSVTNGGNGHSYEAILKSLTWSDARLAAEMKGGHLSTIASSAENSFVFSLVSGDTRFWYLNQFNAGIGPWLGGFQPDGSSEPGGGWSWVTAEPFSFTNWSGGEPNNSGNAEKLLHFYNGGGLIGSAWNDVGPSVITNGYIIEYETAVPESQGMVGWWPGDGNARDIQNGNNGVLQNGAGFAAGEVGDAFNLDGADELVRVPASSFSDIGASASGLTVDAWVRPTSDDTNPIVEWSETSSYGVHFWAGYGCLSASPTCEDRGPLSRALYANIVDAGGVQHRLGTQTAVLTLDTWSHVALTYNKTTGDAVIYVNGDAVVATNIGTFTPHTNLPLNIGARPLSDGGCTGNGCFFGGQIDEVQIFDRPLTQLEIQSIFFAGSEGKCKPFCVTPPSNLVGWWPGDGNATALQNGNDGALHGGATYGSGKVGQAFSLNGTTAYVEAPADSAQDPTTAGSLDAWVYLNSVPSQAGHWMSIIVKGGPGTDFNLQVFNVGDGDRFYFQIANNVNVRSNTLVQPGRWYHVAGTWDSTVGLKIYVNGMLENANPAQVVRSQSNAPVRIGDDLFFGPRRFDGLIDEVEIFDRTLTALEIQAIYDAGTAGKCKPEIIEGELINLSSRLFVGKNENVLIGGFIITGTEPKTVMLRGIGPSLALAGISDALQNPILQLRDHTGALLSSNDDWMENQAAIEGTGLAPSDSRESAILATLSPGAYTVVMEGRNSGAVRHVFVENPPGHYREQIIEIQDGVGVGLLEAFNLSGGGNSRLVNLSSRGFVGVGNRVLIDGMIVGAGNSSRLLVRAIGPTLQNFGLANCLQDPTLELRDHNGGIIASNDNWQDSQQAEIQATGLAPAAVAEAALISTLDPGSFTAIVRGNNDGMGVALVEVYELP